MQSKWSKWKKWGKLLMLLGVFTLLGGAGKAMAEGPFTSGHALVIKVSISASKAFTVDKSTWNFAAMSADATSVSSAAIVVTNTSGGITQTYQLEYSTPTITPAGWVAGASWNTTTAETYVLGAQFSTAQPANADASWANDIVQTATTVCTAGTHGNTVLGESGASVADTGARNLWFRIETPATTTDATQHSIYVTLSMQ